MKKIKILLGFSAAMTAFCALALLNNICAVINWWRAFLAADGDSAAVAGGTGGCFGWLDWTAVDYSAVTTLIPFVGFLMMSISLYKVVRGKRMSTGDFPFFHGSDQLNVALGLFGTLWGIIVIGYFQLDSVSMADLMQCLHTALFSTLMAVVWVFMIDRPVLRPLATRWLAEAGMADTDDGDLTAAVDRLVVRLGEASDEFERRQREFNEAFAERQRRYEEGFAARLDASDAALSKRQAECDAALTKRQAECDEALLKRQAQCDAALAKCQSEFDAALIKCQNDFQAAFSQRLSDLDSAMAKRQTEYDQSLAERLAALSKIQAEFEERAAKRQAEYEEASESRRKAYEAEFDARQKEYVEFFRRRIDELEARARESEGRLKAVQEALRG